MRVLLVDYSIGFGGATKSLGLVCQAMRAVELRVLTCQQPEQYHRWYPGLPVHRFRRIVNYRSMGNAKALLGRSLGRVSLKAVAATDFAVSAANVVRVTRLLRRHRIDVVHLNNGFQPPEAIWAARLVGIPCVVHMRGFPPVDAVRRARPYVRKVIAISRSVAGAVAAGGYPPDDIPLVWDPVDLALFDRTAYEGAGVRNARGIAEEDVAVGFFGRVVRWKGQLEFVRAALGVLEQGARIRPVIVGDVSDGEEDYMDEVRAMVSGSRFADRFIFAGYQPEPAAYYHAMDVVVHFSIEPEPFGMVVPEGMAAGKPVIAADAGGPVEVIDTEVDGLLVPSGNVAALAVAMARLAGDPHLRSTLGAKARRKARGRFSIAHAARETVRVYESALAKALPAPV